jgi:hypothetical protein
VKRLEGFLNDVVIPTIEYRSSKGGLIGDENNKEFSGKVPHLHLNKDIDDNINKETENCSNQNV